MSIAVNENVENKVIAPNQNELLAKQVIDAVMAKGVTEFCICPGSRNSPFLDMIIENEKLTKHFWFEERSAAFFALGRTRESNVPVAVIVTSGTAVGELMPAAMEGFYSQTPIILITADRPRRFRGKGAPQSAEQVGIFGVYTPYSQDIEAQEICSLDAWDCKTPAHLNICFEEPQTALRKKNSDFTELSTAQLHLSKPPHTPTLDQFLEQSKCPMVIVSAIADEAKEAVAQFILHLNAPVFLESTSGLREDVRLRHLRITRTEDLWHYSAQSGYPIDGILRIGGMPTIRLWRDLEDKPHQILVCSISDRPFSGLSWTGVTCVPLKEFFQQNAAAKRYSSDLSHGWRSDDHHYQHHLHELFAEEPRAEATLVHHLSNRIPSNSMVFLGNSLPIREWDLAAIDKDKHLQVRASRGINGIDGQISTFLGLTQKNRHNWAILGDLTALYDLAGPWILSQMDDRHIAIVIINNSGGQIFSRMFNRKECLNPHQLSFEPFAKLWGLNYERWEQIPRKIESCQRHLIEIIPDNEASARFWKRLNG